jgi:putative nucleotidyltransferase with HDIG domain
LESDLSLPADSPIMVVDDDPAVLESLTLFLQRLGYPAKGFVNPVEARDQLEAGEPVHLLITDQEMPEVNGIKLIQAALEADPNTVAIIVTGFGQVESAASALRLGVVDYLLKPVDLTLLGLAVQQALRTRAQSIFHREAYGRLRADVEAKSAEVERQKAQLETITLASLSALVQLLEARSPHFQDHSQAVSRLAAAMASEMSLPEDEVEAVRVAGLLHDIGMIAVPDSIIDKDEKLTAEEFARIREHPRVAEVVLRPFQNLGRAVDYVLFHHERLNGSGYPEGRRSKDIPLGAQIVGVADSYVALLESRAFREAVTGDEALAMLRGAEGTWFAGHVLDALEASTQVA